MTQKVLTREMEVEQLKNTTSKIIEEPKNIVVHEKIIENQLSETKCSKNVVQKLDEQKKGKDKKDLIKGTDSKVEFFNCSKCKYKCKKILLLKNHMANKHDEHNCAEKVSYII